MGIAFAQPNPILVIETREVRNPAQHRSNLCFRPRGTVLGERGRRARTTCGRPDVARAERQETPAVLLACPAGLWPPRVSSPFLVRPIRHCSWPLACVHHQRGRSVEAFRHQSCNTRHVLEPGPGAVEVGLESELSQHANECRVSQVVHNGALVQRLRQDDVQQQRDTQSET